MFCRHDGPAHMLRSAPHGCEQDLLGLRQAGASLLQTWADRVYEVDLAVGPTNALVVFSNFNPPTVTNGPDLSYPVCSQLIDLSP